MLGVRHFLTGDGMEECPLVLGGGGGGVLAEAGLMTQLPEVDPVELSLLTEGLC